MMERLPFIALGGEAVHEDGVGPGLGEEGVVDLVVAEGALALGGFCSWPMAQTSVRRRGKP